MSDITEMYSSTLNGAKSVMERVLSEKSDALAECHALLADFHKIFSVIQARTEAPIYASAIHDMQMSMFVVSLGAYRQAFATLRKSLETVVSGCYFSGNLCELKMWEKGKRDIRWTEMLEGENGALGKKFVEAFSDVNQVEVEKYKEIAFGVYRELSGYVHNERRTSYSDGINLLYSEVEFEKFVINFKSVADVSLFLLTLRYLEEFSSEELGDVENIVNDRLGDIRSFQLIIGGQSGG